MNRVFGTGLALAGLGIVGYVVGVVAPYPGRAFSITGVMVGITLAAIGSAAKNTGGEGST